MTGRARMRVKLTAWCRHHLGALLRVHLETSNVDLRYVAGSTELAVVDLDQHGVAETLLSREQTRRVITFDPTSARRSCTTTPPCAPRLRRWLGMADIVTVGALIAGILAAFDRNDLLTRAAPTF